MIKYMFLILLNFASYSSMGQSSDTKISKSVIKVGLDLRLGFINILNFKAVTTSNPSLPFIGEKNMQGLGLNLGYQHNFINGVGLEYNMRFRYDYVKSNSDFANSVTNNNFFFVAPELPDSKAFLVDHSFRLYKYIGKKDLTKKVGIGYSIINTNKIISELDQKAVIDGVTYVSEGFIQVIEFNTIDFFVSLPIKQKIYLTNTVHYILKGHPTNPNRNFLSFSVGLFYHIQIKR